MMAAAAAAVHSISRRLRSLTGFFCTAAKLQAASNTVAIATPALFLSNPTARKVNLQNLTSGHSTFSCHVQQAARDSLC